VKLQVDIPKELNKKLKVYKIKKDFITLQEAVLDILNKFLEKENGK